MKLVSKQIAGDFDVYDLGIPIHHNFIVNGIDVHNSTDPKNIL